VRKKLIMGERNPGTTKAIEAFDEEKLRKRKKNQNAHSEWKNQMMGGAD
jgi:hypothetical protein